MLGRHEANLVNKQRKHKEKWQQRPIRKKAKVLPARRIIICWSSITWEALGWRFDGHDIDVTLRRHGSSLTEEASKLMLKHSSTEAQIIVTDERSDLDVMQLAKGDKAWNFRALMRQHHSRPKFLLSSALLPSIVK
ncbi:MAG: hypothetical protein Q9218_005245 [Villophora microphyllina]